MFQMEFDLGNLATVLWKYRKEIFIIIIVLTISAIFT